MKHPRAWCRSCATTTEIDNPVISDFVPFLVWGTCLYCTRVVRCRVNPVVATFLSARGLTLAGEAYRYLKASA